MPLSDNATHSLERVAILSRLVAKYCGENDILTCIKLAKDLSNVICELSSSEVNFSDLSREFFDFFPEHWKERTQFLLIVTKYWPEISRELKETEHNAPHTLSTEYHTSFEAASTFFNNSDIFCSEVDSLYEEIDLTVDIIRKRCDQFISIVSPNRDFTNYLSQKLHLDGIRFASNIAPQKIPQDFIDSAKEVFQDLSEMDFKKVIKELSDYIETEKDDTVKVSIIRPMDIPHSKFDILVYTELNDLYWKPENPGAFWLHNILRSKLKLNQSSREIERCFWYGIEKAKGVYLIRAQKSNGQNVRKCSFLAKLQAIAKKNQITIKPIRLERCFAEPPRISHLSEFNFENLDLNVRDLELLFKDPESFYAKEVLGLIPEDNEGRKDFIIAFRNMINAHFSNTPTNPWLDLMKEIDFFNYRKALNFLKFIEKIPLEKSKDNVVGRIDLDRFHISIFAYFDRIVEEGDSATLIDYQTTFRQLSTKEVLYGDEISFLSKILIAERGGIEDLTLPIRKIQIWNILANEESQIITKEIEISEEIVSQFENRLFEKIDGYIGRGGEKDCKLPLKPIYSRYRHFKRE